MLIKSAKKILGVPIDNSATSYHRIIMPLFELKQKGSPWAENIQFLGENENLLEQYDWANILFLNVLYAPDAYKFYAEQKKKNKLIILDFDDDYINIPSDSPEQTEVIDKNTGEVYRFPSELRSIYVQMFIQLADIVTVTTESLRILYSSWAKNIKVIPNCVSNSMKRDIPKIPNSKIRILWSGSNSHLPDLQLLKKPLETIHEKYKDKIEIHFQGGLDFQSIFENLPIVCHPEANFADYLNVIQDISPDIFLAPLQENIFNASKSNLKYSQMTLMETAFIASPFGPYNHIDHDYDGMLAKNENEWVDSIAKCIENAGLRTKLVANATKYVENNHMIEKQLYHWEQLFAY